MIRSIHQQLTRSKAKWWLMMGSLLGVGMLPCPECGTPMILHVWPLAGIVLIVQAMKKRSPKEERVGSETAPVEPGTQVSAGHHEDGCDWDVMQAYLAGSLKEHVEKLL